MHNSSEIYDVALVGSTSMHCLPEKGKSPPFYTLSDKYPELLTSTIRSALRQPQRTHLHHRTGLLALLPAFLGLALVRIDYGYTRQPVVGGCVCLLLLGHGRNATCFVEGRLVFAKPKGAWRPKKLLLSNGDASGT
jgi:hypothetical protein